MADEPQAAVEADEIQDVSFDVSAPVIVDLGKQRRKRVRSLKKGRGRLWDEVAYVVDEVGVSLGEEIDGKVLVPVVVIYEKKRKKRKRVLGW